MAWLDNLTAYWKLDETSDGSGAVTRVDAHGSNDLTDNNTTPHGTGKIGNCVDFEVGNSEYLSLADNADMSSGDIDFSISLWFQLESLGNDPGLFVKGQDSDNTREYQIRVGGDNKIRFSCSPDGTTTGEVTVVGNAGNALSTATWYHVVAYHDATANEIGIAVNDETPVVAAYSAGLTDLGGIFWISRQSNSTTYHDGLVDEAGWWKRVLTSTEITALYNSGNGFAYPFAILKAIGGSITNTGALFRDTRKITAGSITNTGAVKKAIDLAHGFAGSITNTGALTRLTKLAGLAGSITNAGALTRKTLKVVAGAITNTGSLATVKAVLQKFYTWTASFRASDREDPYHAGSDEKRGRA